MEGQGTEIEFSQERYINIISLLQAKNFDFKLIGDSTEGDRIIFMRHDVDLSLRAARIIADVDNKMGISSTFFFMTRSNLYNLFSPVAKEVIHHVSELGHRIGLHFLCESNQGGNFNPSFLEREIEDEFSVLDYYYPHIFWKVVSFHNPIKEVLGLKLVNYVSAYEDKYFKAIKYLSESLQVWREGDLYKIIEEDIHPKLQVLTHPVYWVFGGSSLNATMENLISSEKSERYKFIRESGITL